MNKEVKQSSRPVKRKGKKINTFLLKLVHAFMLFRQNQVDKNSQEVVNKFSGLELKWISACNKYNIKDRAAFKNQVNALIIEENKLTQQINESALKQLS